MATTNSKAKISKAKMSKSKMSKSKKMTKGHYVSSTRKSPAFPAQECKNETKKGRDSKWYKSIPDKNGRFRWVCITKSKKAQTKKIVKSKSNVKKAKSLTRK